MFMDRNFVYLNMCICASNTNCVHRNHPGIMGENGGNLPHVFSIIAEALMQEVVEEKSEVYHRLLGIVRQVQVSVY